MPGEAIRDIPVPKRWSASWPAFVAQTGQWHRPRAYRNAKYVAQSPWPRHILKTAMERTRRVFTDEVARRVFDNPGASPTLYSLLFDVALPTHSELLRLGFDLSWAGKIPVRLARVLTREQSYWGARFEVAVLAAARRAGIGRCYDPLRTREGRGPDLLLALEEPVFVELKAPDASNAWRQRQRTYEAIVLGGRDGSGMIDVANVDIGFTQEFHRLDATDVGRSELARTADELARDVASAARDLTSGTAIVNGLVRLTARTDGRPGQREPLVPHCEDEAARVIDRHLLDACGQLPAGHCGLVVVETERVRAPVAELQRRAVQWFVGPIGREFAHVAGVLFTHRPWWTGFPGTRLVPVWRDSAPKWLVRSRLLEDIDEALRWFDRCVQAWRRGGGRMV